MFQIDCRAAGQIKHIIVKIKPLDTAQPRPCKYRMHLACKKGGISYILTS